MDRKNNRNWTQPDRLGPDQWSIYGPVFFSPVASCPVFKNIVGPIKTGFNRLQPVHTSRALYPRTFTHNSINFAPWIIKNDWELREIWPNTFGCEYFVVIWVVVIVLLIPCATKILDTIGHYPRQRNNIHKHLWDVHLIHLTALTSCNYIRQTTNCN